MPLLSMDSVLLLMTASLLHSKYE